MKYKNGTENILDKKKTKKIPDNLYVSKRTPMRRKLLIIMSYFENDLFFF